MRRHVVPLQLAALMVLVSAQGASAADDPVRGIGAVGSYVQPGAWSEVVVTVNNRSQQDQQATVTVVAPGDAGKARFSRVVHVPARRSRATRVQVLLPEQPASQGPDAPDAGPRQAELPLTLFTSSAGLVERSYLAWKLAPDASALCIPNVRGERHDTDRYVAAGGHIAVCEVRFLDAAGNVLPSAGDAPALESDTGWTTRTVERTVPPAARRIVVAPTLYGTGTLDIGEIRIDPVVGEGAVPTLAFGSPSNAWQVGNVPIDAEGGFARLKNTQHGTTASFEARTSLPAGLSAVRVSVRLRGDKLYGGRGVFGNMRRLVGHQPRWLPTRWAGLEMVDLLLFKAVTGDDLRPSQMQAILDWARRGGTLVLVADEALPELLMGPAGRAAGVTAAGIHRVSRLDVRQADNDKPVGQFTLTWPMPLAELVPSDATVHYRANGLPLLTERPLGAGRVLVLGVPLGALDLATENRKTLHAVLAAVRPMQPRTAQPIDVNRADAPTDGQAPPTDVALRSIAGRQGPTAVLPVTLLAALSVLTLLAGLLLRLRGRGEWVWLGLIPASLCLSVGLYAWGRSRIATERLSFVGLITPVGHGEVRVQESFAYTSGRTSRELSFSAGVARATIRPTDLTSMTRRNEVRTGAELHIPARSIRTGGGAMFRTDALCAAPGIDSRVSFDAHGLSGRIVNRMPADLTHCVILTRNRTYRLTPVDGGANTVPADGVLRFRLGEASMLRRVTFDGDTDPAGAEKFGPIRGAAQPSEPADGEFTGSAVMNRTDNLRNAFVGRLLRDPAGVTRDAAPTLIGYTSYCPLDPLADRSVPRQGWNVVAWPLEITPPAPENRDRPVTIPAGFVVTDYEGSAAWNRLSRRFTDSHFDGALHVLAKPPEGFGRLRDVTATLIVTLRANGRRLSIFGVRGGRLNGGDHVVPPGAERTRIDNPRLRDARIVIPDADAFRNARGQYVFLLRVESIGGLPADITEVPKWRFERVDVALKGRYEKDSHRGDE
ncbi:MAG: hypothetical protein KGY99_02570 [Phycisphaerae bacterium]|nr:hypothetical protein [Phycisphaerae bacterium]